MGRPSSADLEKLEALSRKRKRSQKGAVKLSPAPLAIEKPTFPPVSMSRPASTTEAEPSASGNSVPVPCGRKEVIHERTIGTSEDPPAFSPMGLGVRSRVLLRQALEGSFPSSGEVSQATLKQQMEEVSEAYTHLGRCLSFVAGFPTPLPPQPGASEAATGGPWNIEAAEALKKEIGDLKESLDREKCSRQDAESLLDSEVKRVQDLAREMAIKEEMFLNAVSRGDQLEEELSHAKKKAADLERRLRNSRDELRLIRRKRETERNERLQLMSSAPVPPSRLITPASLAVGGTESEEVSRLRRLLKETKDKVASEKRRVTEVQQWADSEVKIQRIHAESARREQERVQALYESAQKELLKGGGATVSLSVLEAVKNTSLDALGRTTRLAFTAGFGACRGTIRTRFSGLDIEPLPVPPVSSSKEVMDAVALATRGIVAISTTVAMSSEGGNTPEENVTPVPPRIKIRLNSAPPSGASAPPSSPSREDLS